MTPRFAICLPVAILALVLVGCSDSTEPLVPTAMELDETALSLTVRESATVEARILDQNGTELMEIPEEYEIEWSVSDGRVIDIDGDTFIATAPGTATLTAEAGDLEAMEVDVTVAPRELSAALSFDYEGDRSGTFELSSTFEMDTGQLPFDWAATLYRPAPLVGQDVLAQRVREEGLNDIFTFWVDQGEPISSTGTFEMSGAYVGFDWDGQPPPEYAQFVDGTLVVTSVTEERMEGTFEATLEDSEGNVLELTNGEFDVPIVTEVELGIAAPPAGAPGVPAGSFPRGRF